MEVVLLRHGIVSLVLTASTDCIVCIVVLSRSFLAALLVKFR